jgi:hypothetical protein
MVVAGQVIPDNNDNVKEDPYEGLEYEECIAFNADDIIIKEVTPDEDDP